MVLSETGRPVNYLCQTILHTLKFQDVLESNIVIKGIAVIKSTANKSSCNSFGNSKRHILVNTMKVMNTTKVMNMIKNSNDKFVKYAV